MTDDQAALLARAKASIEAARLLASGRFHNFAASRAYYAMLYAAEALLLEEGLAFSKHSAVIAAFGEHFVKTGRVPADYHRYLIEGEAARHTGDYDVRAELTEQDAANQIKQATAFVEMVRGEMP